MVKKIIIGVLISLLVIAGAVLFFNNRESGKETVDIKGILASSDVVFFYSDTCPHCTAEKEFLNQMQSKYPAMRIARYEVINNAENREILRSFYEQYSVSKSEEGRVPVTFTKNKYFIGFGDSIASDLETCLQECIEGKGSAAEKIKIPFLGEIDIKTVSLPVLTVVLGTLDGFNPCAMWVLVILISMLLAAKSRKKIALVGGTFIFAEGLLYFLFMAAWLNVFFAMGQVSLIRILIGVFGIIFGIWRLHDFATWKPGVCKVTETTKSESRILDRINKVMEPAALPATIFGVIILAFSINLVEFFCSAGFPVIYTKILSAQGIGGLQYYLYLLAYNLFYMLDDFVVFGFAFFTLSRFGFSEKYNKYSTLVAGLLILILGIVLILKPEILTFG